MSAGPRKDRWNPTSPKANPHWARMYAAKRRAIDAALLAACERALTETEQSGPVMSPEADQACSEVERLIQMRRHADPAPWPSMSLDEAAKVTIARAFGRPGR